jgi:hypothetical protein
MAPKKKPFVGAPVTQPAKTPRVGEQPPVEGMKFCWRVSEIDWQGPWGWSKVTCEQLLGEIIPRLHEFEGMTWGQVVGTGSHFVDVTAMVDEAQRRLTEIGKDEQAQLFSVRIAGKKRVWGIRDIAILRVLWWDPEHEVCPSLKRHT